MKDKEIIEEMANCYKCVCKPVCMKTADINEKQMLSWNEYIKQYGCQYYQPKLPEDSVVLSREEYIDLSRNYVGEQVAQARKETAEKILKGVKKRTVNWIGKIGFFLTYEELDELVKSVGVEIKD